MPDLFALLQRCLPLAVPPEKIALVGGWSRSIRRMNACSSQDGCEADARVDAVDAIWTVTVECRVPTVGIAFLRSSDDRVYWIKSAPAAFGQPLKVSVSTHFGAGWGEFSLPFVPLRVAGDPAESCRLGALATTTGVLHVVCEVEDTTLFIALVQGALVRTGRCRNWHLRPQAAALLPAELQALFTQRRSGSWWAPHSERASDASAGSRSR